MQNQNMPWAWSQPGAPAFSAGPVFPSAFSPATVDQNQLMTGYQQMYGTSPGQPPPDYGTTQWSAAQLQHWQQWQQWQEKYQQWQAQYGKKYAESIAAMGQNPSLVLPNVPPIQGMMKPAEAVTNPGYTTANPPPPPSNAQPVPPPPPEEEKLSTGSVKERTNNQRPEPAKDNPEELSEAEKTFDVQFKQWEDQFNEWKKQNQDHPDKAQYREYEKKWETWREQLLQRREQMRKKRLSKTSEGSSDGGKVDEPKSKIGPDQGPNQGKEPEIESGYKTADGQNQTQGIGDAKFENKSTVPFPENQEMYQSQKAAPESSNQMGNMNVTTNFIFPPPNVTDGTFPNLPDGQNMDRNPGYFDRKSPTFKPGMGMFPYRMDGREGQRFGNVENSQRTDFQQRRPFGNGNFEEDRSGFGQRFGNFGKGKDFGQERFVDGRKFISRDFAGGQQLGDQGFVQGGRNFPERNFGADPKTAFGQKNNFNNAFTKPKVPSLFDITVEKPPGLVSPGKDRKPKVWEKYEKDNYYDDPFEEKKDEKNLQRGDKPWMSNVAWAKNNNSPWIKPWELDRVVQEKPADANLRPDAWQKDSMDKSWTSEIDKSELSGYVGNILAKLGNFNVMPPSLPGKEGPFDGKMNDGMGWQGRDHSGKGDAGLIPNAFNQDSINFNRDRFDESSGNFPSQTDGYGPKDRANREDVVLFGKGDCDERFRFDRDGRNFGRDGRNFPERNFGANEDRGVFRRDDRGSFQEDRRVPGREEERLFGRGDRNSFGSRFDDIDERIGRSRNGRRLEDRDERGFRGAYDRDERRSRNFNAPFERNFGRNLDSGMKEPEWNPQVFDYSKGSQQGFRSRLPDSEDNFQISTVVDYSHGENKQTFDYAHGERKNDNLEVRSFDYGHGSDAPAVIDYAHGGDKDNSGIPPWKKDGDMRNERSHSKSKSPSRRSRSPRGRQRSRSRSPHPGTRGRRPSNSPPFRGHRSRSRDRFGRQIMRRNRRNSSEEKSSQNADGEISKSNFDVTTVLVEDLICSPGRDTRPNKLVFIMRGLPGSGKTYVTKLIKDREVEMGGDAPRILSLDDYFMTEVEKEVVDEETGRKVKKKMLEYEYESCAEPHYRGSLLKAFKKTISDGFFGFIIVDSVNEKTKDYEEMWSFAKQKGFQVYVAEMDDDVAVCTKRNIHKRTEKEISDLAKAWEKTPNHYLRLDVRSLLQADAITEVEMEVVSDTDNEKATVVDKPKETEAEEEEENVAKEDEEEDEAGESTFVKSRWDHFENSEQKLDRLDGLKRRREGFHATMQDYLQLPDDFDLGSNEPTDGKKKVRWADLEERRQQEKMRAIGFVVGQTDWSRMTDPTFGESALTRTKYI